MALSLAVQVVAVAPAAADYGAKDPLTGELYDPGTALAHFQVTSWDGTGSSFLNWVSSSKGGTAQNGASKEVSWSWVDPSTETIHLDGADDYVSTLVNVATDRSFTVSAWAELKKGAPASIAVSADGARMSAFYLGADADGHWTFGMPVSDTDGSAADVIVGPAASSTHPSYDTYEWAHLTGVYDADAHQMRLYVNGVLVGSRDHTSNWNATGFMQIGRGLTSGNQAWQFSGYLDEIRAWQTTLPDDLIADLVVKPVQVREDICKVQQWLHAGGPRVKAAVVEALASGPAAVRQLLTGRPYTRSALEGAWFDDDAARITKGFALDESYANWENIVKVYPIWDRPITWSKPAEFGADVSAYLDERYDRTFNHYFDVPRPSKGPIELVEAAVQMLYQLQQSGSTIGVQDWQLRSETDGWYAENIRMFLLYNGYATVAPAVGSADFRREVESLKSRWAGCDPTNPPDKYGVWTDMVATARSESGAELDAVAAERAEIVAAEAQAAVDLQTATDAMIQVQGQAWIVERLMDWQQYWPKHMNDWEFYGYDPALFEQAKTDMAAAQQRAAEQALIARNAADSARVQADIVTAAQERANQLATANGTPVGRNLSYAQQSAQAAKAAAAAATAAAKAADTAAQATTATLADSRILASLASVQAQAVESEFRRAAAVEAAEQADAAQLQAADQAERAAAAADRAEVAKGEAALLEKEAEAAAARAREQRLIAEQEGTATATAQAKAEAAAFIAQSESAKAAQAAQDVAAFTAEADSAKSAALAAAGEANAAATVAAQAQSDAAAARAAADQAVAEAATLAGQALAASQAVTAARDAAATMVTAADEAVALGTPYQAVDISAGLSVLVAQKAKTFGQQQLSIVEARSTEAVQKAAEANAAAQAADGDAKIAATAAARAADAGVAAAQWLTEAQASATAATTDTAAVHTSDTNIQQYAALALADAEAAVTAANGGTPPPPDPYGTAYFEPINRLGEQVRYERCRAGHLLNIGGPTVKATAGAALAGTREDVHAAVSGGGWSSSPLWGAYLDDNQVTLEYLNNREARYAAWEEVLSPYPIWGDDFLTFDRAQPFDQDLAKFIDNRQDLVYEAWSADLVTRPGQAELDRAVEIMQAQAAAGDTLVNWVYKEEWMRSYLSADDVRMILQYGGAPKVAPVPGTLEFRSEVEALKARWAGCDFRGPSDPYRVLTEVIAAAHVEWESELDAQATARAQITTAELQATKDVQTASDAMVEAVGQAWIAGQLLKWQEYWPDHMDDWEFFGYDDALFDQARAELLAIEGRIQTQIGIAQTAVASAQAQADQADAAVEAATQVALGDGAPVGRGLAYAQQSAQVAKASAAAALAALRATETAYSAAVATAEDSATLWSLATVQAKAIQAEFRRAAAEEAAAQALMAADTAQQQANEAKANADKALAERDKAVAAQHIAEVAAADAHAKRLAAEAERPIAAQQRAIAETERAKAAAAEATAQSQSDIAAQARAAAQSSASTADQRRQDAERAEQEASAARSRAAVAEHRRDVAEAKAAALEAAAAAAEGTEAAAAARAAADQAWAEAETAATAASGARAAANSATEAAQAARAAATEATAAASRARADADAAEADARITRVQAATAHVAAAEAIEAAEAAAHNVRVAQQAAATASDSAATAKSNARAAWSAATGALAESAVTAARAFATDQAAQAAAGSAAAASAAAVEAVQLGTPYRATDVSAGLAVLVGQTAKTLAEQQADLAAAKAAQADSAAQLAAELAQQAAADAKAAADAAAQAAADAARAAHAVADAQRSAADAAIYAAAAKVADEETARLAYVAWTDAMMADIAAYGAEDDAAIARSLASEAEQDAASARAAATQAESDAAVAQTAATEADADADAAEVAAANAQADAAAAQDSVSRLEDDLRNQNLGAWSGGSNPAGFVGAQVIPGDDLVEEVTTGDCVITGYVTDPTAGCDVTVDIHVTGTLHFLVATCTQVDGATTYSCYLDYVGSTYVDQWYHSSTFISAKQLFDQGIQIAVRAVFGDFIDCAKAITGEPDGKVSGCAWVAGMIIAPTLISQAAKAISSVRMAILTSTGMEEALAAARALGLDGVLITRLEQMVAKATHLVTLADDLAARGLLGPLAIPAKIQHLVPGSYQRFGYLTREQFVAKYWDETADTWNWVKAAPNGGAVPGTEAPYVPKAGEIWDRFGSNYGNYFSPLGTSFPARAVPPENLGKDYTKWKWLKDWDPALGEIQSSTVRGAFEQRGGGIQFKTPQTVEWLKANDYIIEVP